MLKLKNFLFDLDGVLINACDWHFETLNDALTYSGYAPISVEDHANKFNGLPSKTKLSMLGIEQIHHESIVQKKAEYLQAILDTRCGLDQDKINLLKHLKNKNGKIACVTNSVSHTAHTVLKKMGIICYFDMIISNEIVSKNKPDPEPYNMAVETLGINPFETMIVEDSIKGFLAAAASKISVIWKVPDASFVTIDNYINLFEDCHE